MTARSLGVTPRKRRPMDSPQNTNLKPGKPFHPKLSRGEVTRAVRVHGPGHVVDWWVSLTPDQRTQALCWLFQNIPDEG